MAHSPSHRFFNGFRNNKKEEQIEKDNVKGWLVNVHSYRDDTLTNNTSSSSSEYILVDQDNNRIPLETGNRRNGRPESIASEDSVNLDDLINNNFTADMEDETDLPDLANLDLDDSADDFFKMESKPNSNEEALDSFDTGFNDFMTKPSDLDWSPKEENKMREKTTKLTPPSPQYLRRSDSFSSENSLTSQSTITQYQRYGMTPLIYPSESTSTSSRSHSRLSNYSASSFASSSTASGIPHRATTTTTTTTTNNNTNNSHSNNNSNNSLLHHPHHHQPHHTTTKTKTPSSSNIGIPTPSRSYTYRDNKSQHLVTPNQRATPLAKRASHIPAPQSASKILPPSPQRTSSSSSARSTGLPTARRTMTPTTTAGHRLQQRSSHIPSVRGGESDNRRFLTAAKEDSTSRPTSPLFNNGRSASRLGGGKKSLFQDRPRSTTPNTNRSGIPTGIPSATPPRTEEKRVMSPTGTRPSGIRPPGTSGLRAPSRIGTIKKA